MLRLVLNDQSSYLSYLQRFFLAMALSLDLHCLLELELSPTLSPFVTWIEFAFICLAFD